MLSSNLNSRKFQGHEIGVKDFSGNNDFFRHISREYSFDPKYS